MSKVYKSLVAIGDRVVPNKLRPLWEHEAGPKTIFFWAPAFKWGLVIAGLGDLQRPVEKISVPQGAVLALTGMIWCRYSFVVIPKNYFNFSVNFFIVMGLVAAGLGDINRPVENLSLSQSGSLAATGLVWSRYSLVIIPKNYSLFAVNVFVALTNLIQLGRIFMHNQNSKVEGVAAKK